MKIEDLGKHHIIIDFNNLFTKSITDIIYKQGEIGTSIIKAKLVKKRESIDLTNCMVIVNIITESGQPIVDNATILDTKEGIVEIKFEQVSLNTGISFFELTVVDDKGNSKKSPKIAYRVLDSFSEDAVIESERFPILVNMIKDVEELHKTSESLIEETNQLKEEVIELNETLIQAEEIRKSQEDTRQENEEVRKLNELERIDNMKRINQEMVDFKEETNNNIEQFKADTEEVINTFKTDINEEISILPRIDDNQESTSNTYSSSKIKEELDKKSEFDGSYNSLTDKPQEYTHPDTHSAAMITLSEGVNVEDKINQILQSLETIITRLENLENQNPIN